MYNPNTPGNSYSPLIKTGAVAAALALESLLVGCSPTYTKVPTDTHVDVAFNKEATKGTVTIHGYRTREFYFDINHPVDDISWITADQLTLTKFVDDEGPFCRARSYKDPYDAVQRAVL